MARFTLGFALAGIVLVGTIGATVLPGAAHAQSTNVHYAAGQQCTLTRVHLNGNQPPTVDSPVSIACTGTGSAARSGGVTPATSTTCDHTSEFFYEAVNKGGGVLCLTGWGWTDLSQVPYGFCCGQSWNDRISSFDNGNTYAGRAYENTMSQGLGSSIPILFNYYEPDLTNTVIQGVSYGNWNDRLSEVCISGPGTTCT